jgi:hypothetical protein
MRRKLDFTTRAVVGFEKSFSEFRFNITPNISSAKKRYSSALGYLPQSPAQNKQSVISQLHRQLY